MLQTHRTSTVYLVGFTSLAASVASFIASFQLGDPHTILFFLAIALVGPAIFFIATGFDLQKARADEPRTPKPPREPRELRAPNGPTMPAGFPMSTPSGRLAVSFAFGILAYALFRWGLDSAAEQLLSDELAELFDEPPSSTDDIVPEVLFTMSGIASVASIYQLTVAAVMRGILQIRSNEKTA